jgi:hypothetical protein
MGEIVHFVPQASLRADENLHAFVDVCRRQLTVFGDALEWESWKWPGAMHFTKIGVTAKGGKDADRLDDQFLDFAKAYFRYQQGQNRTKAKNEAKALRVIEASLLQIYNAADIALLDFAVLDEAATTAKKHYSGMAAYHCGRELERLARFVSEKNVISGDVSTWKSPLRRPSDSMIQTGPRAQAVRRKKLPNEVALNALMEIFANNPSDPRDIFTSSVFAMLMCAPSRCTEILELPADLEVEEKDGNGVMRYGWRFFSGKGYEGSIKWIPTEMVSIAKEAVRRIKALTDEPRRLAKWIEDQPELFYRHQKCPDVGEFQPLTAMEAAAALGLIAFNSRQLPKRSSAHTLSSLWQVVLERQPKGFPYLNKEIGVRYSEALFCMARNMLNGKKGVSPVVLWAPSIDSVNDDLQLRESVPGVFVKGIFERHSYRDEFGLPIKMTSHQVRHLLNTMAQKGGMPQGLIAKWSGRVDEKQNRAYNHVSEWEMVAQAEAIDGLVSLMGPAGDISQHVPVSAKEFALVERGAVHTTEFGFCTHDYLMSPCDKYRDCLNCAEQVCIKGSGDCLARLKARLAEIEIEKRHAEVSMREEEVGADRWYEHHQRAELRLRQIVEIMESPQVMDGAQIRLRDGRDYSHLGRALGKAGVELLDGVVAPSMWLGQKEG